MESKNRRRWVIVFSVLVVVVLLFMLSGSASAAWWNPVSWVIGAFELASGVIKQVYNLVQMVMNLTPTGVMDFIAGIVKTALEKFFDAMKYFLTWNPTVYCPPGAAGCEQNEIIAGIIPTIMTIIQPFYVTMAIFTGMYYIFAAMDPKRRAESKNMLLKLLVGMVVVGLSLPIFQLLLDLSSSLTEEVFRAAYAQFQNQSGRAIAVLAVVLVIAMVEFPILIVVALFVGMYIVIAVLLVMGVRYVAVVLLAIMFPISLFLYFFNSTKNIGASLVYQTLSWVFVPVVQAFMIVITFFALEGMITGGAAMVTDPDAIQRGIEAGGISPTTVFMMFFMVLGGLAGVIISPLIMMHFMKWVGGAIAGYGMLKIPQAQTKQEFWAAALSTTVGGTMMGGLSKGMQFGMTQAAYMAQYFSPTFGDSARWSDVMPSLGEMKGWLRGGSGGVGTATHGGQPGGAAPFTGAAARARDAMGEGRGLVRDFFKTYRKALTYDRLKSSELVDRYGLQSGGGSASSAVGERGMPLSTATTVDGSGRGQYGQYNIIREPYRATSVYMPVIEGPPFVSIPLYFLGGVWGSSLKRAGKAFKSGEYAKGVGISLFESFKMFSPFRPVRHLGRILYAAIPEFVPPFIPFPVPFIGWTLRDVAWWGSRRMMGVGLGQMASRGGWNLSLAASEGDFNSAFKRLRNAEKLGDPAAAGKARKKALGDMEKSAGEYAKTLEGIRDGAGIREMKDPDFYNKKLEQLRDYNRELHYGVVKRLTVGMEESRGDVIRAAKKVDRVGGDRSKMGNDFEKLMFDYIGYKYKEGGANSLIRDIKKWDAEETQPGEKKKNTDVVGDFMKYNAAMKLGVGVAEWGFNREAFEDGEAGSWSKKRFDLDAMGGYIKRHEGLGVSLAAEEGGEFEMSAHRLLYGDAYNCATQHEVIKLSDDRRLPNIYIYDAASKTEGARQLAELDKKIGDEKDSSRKEQLEKEKKETEKRLKTAGERERVYSFVDADGSEYVERMRNHYETGGGLQPIWGLDDPRTQQYLDATGSGFERKRRIGGFSYSQSTDGFAVHYKSVQDYKSVPVKNLVLKEEWSRSDAKDAREIERIEKRGWKVLTKEDMGDVGYIRDLENHIGKRVTGFTREDVMRKEDDFKKDREEAVRDYKEKIGEYVENWYGGKYPGIESYKTDLDKANQAVYFSGDMVDHLRHRGYSDFEIDHLKLVICQNPRYRELIERGETIDVNIDDNPGNPNTSWVNTDDAGRRWLTINVGSKAYGEADHECSIDGPSKFMQDLQNGDILAHEATHDRIREQYGMAGYDAIWEDFVRESTKLSNVFDERIIQSAKEGIAGTLGISVSELGNDRTLRRKLRERGMTKEDLGFMLCEGLADVGGTVGARPEASQTAYNESVKTFIKSESARILGMTREEKAANIAPGSWSSDITEDDVSLLARMKSLAGQSDGYVDSPEVREELVEEVSKAERELAGSRMLRNFSAKVEVYKAVHSQAALPETGGLV